MFSSQMTIAGYDDELWTAMQSEVRRQEEHIELIASENYASPRVMEAQGSVLTNKYAEGYPAKRYYGGCEYVDKAEQLAIDRVKQLFGADYANVQPHSGSQANAAVYMALLNPGDTVLGMSLAHGGHLTHGAKVNFSGKIYNAVQYGITLVPASRSNVIFLFELIIAAIAAFWLTQERMDWQEWVGAAMIITSSLFSGKMHAMETTET